MLILIVSATAAYAVNQHFFSQEFLSGVQEHFGQRTVTRVLAWGALLQRNAGRTERMKLEQVNAFFNRMANVSDIANWGRRDYWATPVELLSAAGGDCEDMAIAKYFSLKMLDVAEERLHLTYVRAYTGGTSLTIVPHMVLTYYAEPDADPLILDNLIDKIKPASRRHDLVPTYSFNANGLWQAQERNRGKRIGDTDHLFKWQNLLERMETEYR